MIKFNASNHTYTLDGKLIPSVTTILKLANSYAGIDKDLLEKAALFGTAVHKATELYDQGILNEEILDTALVPYLNGWKKFIHDTKFVIEQIETVVYSRHGYAGTLDRLGTLNGKTTILDIKSGTTVARTTSLQLAAYQEAYEELFAVEVAQRICVHLKPDDYSIKVYENPSDLMTFLNFLNVNKWINNE